MKTSLVEVRKQAEQAVSDMHDGELKNRAFETILKHLLSSTAPTEPDSGRQKDNAPPKARVSTNTRPETRGERILFLKSENFFKSQRSIGDIRAELKKNGWHYPVTSLSGELQSLVQKRELRREYVEDGDGRKGWKYSNP